MPLFHFVPASPSPAVGVCLFIMVLIQRAKATFLYLGTTQAYLAVPTPSSLLYESLSMPFSCHFQCLSLIFHFKPLMATSKFYSNNSYHLLSGSMCQVAF